MAGDVNNCVEGRFKNPWVKTPRQNKTKLVKQSREKAKERKTHKKEIAKK